MLLLNLQMYLFMCLLIGKNKDAVHGCTHMRLPRSNLEDAMITVLGQIISEFCNQNLIYLLQGRHNHIYSIIYAVYLNNRVILYWM